MREQENGFETELSTGRMDLRIGSGRVSILPDFGGSVESALRIY